MRHKKVLIIMLAALLGLLTAACRSSDAPAAPAADGAVADSAESAAETGTLVIYSGRSESLVGPIIAQFADVTGIDVSVRYGSTGEMAALLLEEGAASPADVFFAQDPGGLGAIENAGLLQALPAATVQKVPTRFAAESGQWVGISGRARVVVYNTAAISDPATQLPADIYDFVDPQWRGRIGWAPTNGSFQAMVTAMRTVWGEEKTRDWLTGIQANEAVVYPSNTPIVAAVGAGEVEVGFVNHYYLYRFLQEEGEGFGARNYFLPGGGPGSLIMVAGAGILTGADNVDNARRFIDFLLSTPSQQYFAAQTFEYPVVDGVATVAELPALETLSAQAVEIGVAEYADLEGTVALLTELGILP